MASNVYNVLVTATDNKRNQQLQFNRILEEKVKSKIKYIGTECKPVMRTIGLLAVTPLRHFGVDLEIDFDDRINMSYIENILHELRINPELQSLRGMKIFSCNDIYSFLVIYYLLIVFFISCSFLYINCRS